jgi:aminoglycoside N3'-acetyltransferase
MQGMSWIDYPRAIAEVLARQIYWRAPGLSSLRGWSRSPARQGPRHEGPTIAAPELSRHLYDVAARFGGLLMVHSSLAAFRIRDKEGEIMPVAKGALWLIQELTRAVGPQGTVCMPTHPLYPDSPGFMFDKSDLVLSYHVERAPSRVGLLTEMFRRTPGVWRSAHPLSSLAVGGVLAEDLLHDNLNDRRPLPHGRDSGYYRFCLRGGGVISLGLGIIRPLTILHVAEEVRDETWPVPGFFYERHFEVREGQREPRRVVVRERRPEFVRSLALSVVRRHLLCEGILEENLISGIRSDVVDARALLEFYQDKQRYSTYPYLLPRLASLGRPPIAAARRPTM